jgi:probable F420-dependent oxidoreductase
LKRVSIVHVGIECLIAESGLTPEEIGRELEQRGFESLWLGEHTHVPTRSRQPSRYAQTWNVDKPPLPLPEPYKALPDPLVTLSLVAAATKSLKLGFGVLLVLEHHPLTVAKSIATLDHFSRGRVLLGVGIGWNQLELANHNPIPWNKRYGAMAEFVDVIRVIWRSDEPEYHGQYYDFGPVWSYPKPSQTGGPPIFVPGTGPVGMRHAAQWGDGWYPMADRIPDLEGALQRFRKLTEELGRDQVNVTLGVRLIRDSDGKWPDPFLLERYRDLGIDRVVLTDDVTCLPGCDEWLRILDTYAAALDHVA